MNLSKNQERDFKKYFKHEGDPNFNPDRNKKVVEDTIRKAEKLRQQKHKEYVESIRERSEAVTSYLLSEHGARSNKSIEKYLGKQNLTYLRGEKIVETIVKKRNDFYKSLSEKQ
jgi:uncharacterized protein YbcC (UPF0753/DUF2309 family)